LQSLAADLSVAAVKLTRNVRGRRSAAQISLTQLSALSTLSREGAMTPGMLASRERVRPPSMTRVIASLCGMGLVGRTPHPTDGRQVIVEATDAGRTLVDAETCAREEWLATQLSVLSDEQLRALRETVDIMNGMAAAAESERGDAV
jgi:DNA-binding MarR family transcriptional regulator